jgi:hypothetical protein
VFLLPHLVLTAVDVESLIGHPWITLLVDALDEVPPHERASSGFKQMLDDVCQLASQQTTTSLRRVVLASRYGALRAMPTGIERVACIARLRRRQATAYVKTLVEHWLKTGGVEKVVNLGVEGIDKVVKLSVQFGVNRSPLMLLMLALLCLDDRVRGVLWHVLISNTIVSFCS